LGEPPEKCPKSKTARAGEAKVKAGKKNLASFEEKKNGGKKKGGASGGLELQTLSPLTNKTEERA